MKKRCFAILLFILITYSIIIFCFVGVQQVDIDKTKTKIKTTTSIANTMTIVTQTSPLTKDNNNIIVETISSPDYTEENNIQNYNYTEYNADDLYVLSHVIYAEAGGCSDEMKIGVGSVVLNRLNDPRFPDTLEGVVFQEGQYACTWDGNYYKEPDEHTVEIADCLLKNGSQMPPYVIFQAGFEQGDSVYQCIDNMYFCYWSEDVY